MSALYRQARPTTFDEMVGQEHVKEVLNNALRLGRLAQAYMFSGPRGVGKTSSARLIAQAVNCSAATKPCGVCEGCRLVREGRHPDVLEIDAASNNSVEDVRDLRERILLAPIMGERKVVILDEAHMMSKSAFNALLKTLEEPPEHVIFIFATTEPERMPPTILSRTQHFKFRRLSEGEIVQKLHRILQGMGRDAEEKALNLVARMADGAMRDAESLLDRLLTLEGTITLAQTEAALGLPPQEALYGVAEAIDRGQIRPALEQAQNLYTQGFAARTLAQGLLEAIRAGLYGRMGLGTGPHLNQPEDRLVAAMTALDETLERLLKRSDALSLELAVLAAYQAMQTAPNAERPTPNAQSQPPQTSTSALPDFDPKPKRPASTSGVVPPTTFGSSAETTSPPSTQPTPVPTPAAVTDLASEWRQVMGALRMNIRAFVREAEPRLEEGKVVLLFPEKASFHFQSAQKHLEDIKKAVQEVLGIQQVELALGGKKKITEEAAKPNPFSPPSSPPQTPNSTKVFSPLPQTPVSFDTLGQTQFPAETTPPNPPLEMPKAPTLEPESKSNLPSPAPELPEANAPPLDEAPPMFGEPEPEPWFPEDQIEALPEASSPAVAKTTLLEDPKFQKVVKLFGGRLRKFYKDTPQAEPETAGDLEAPEEDGKPEDESA